MPEVMAAASNHSSSSTMRTAARDGASKLPPAGWYPLSSPRSWYAISRRPCRVLPWALVVLVVGGCGTHVIGLRSDPSFTHETMSTGGIAVGGVTSIAGADDPITRRKMTSLLRACILEERSDVEVQPIAMFPHAVGPLAYGELMADYRRTGEISAPWLEHLSRDPGKAQYVIFARIERDSAGRNAFQGEGFTTYKVSRTVGVGFLVFDLTKMASVWSGYITKTKDKHNKVDDEEEEQSGGFLANIVGDLLESIVAGALGLTPPSTYPDYPRFTETLDPIFQGFAEHLPE